VAEFGPLMMFAEQLPFLTLEPHHLQLLDRGEVGWPEVLILTPGSKVVGLPKVLQVRRLPS